MEWGTVILSDVGVSRSGESGHDPEGGLTALQSVESPREQENSRVNLARRGNADQVREPTSWHVKAVSDTVDSFDPSGVPGVVA